MAENVNKYWMILNEAILKTERGSTASDCRKLTLEEGMDL
jgi:hypothetical protein